ncbi:MAG: hypothetical protein ACRYGF_03665 [Janthinobacterium lividum]
MKPVQALASVRKSGRRQKVWCSRQNRTKLGDAILLAVHLFALAMNSNTGAAV